MTIAPENPPGFVVRTEAQKVAFDNGFRISRGEQNGWLGFASTTAWGEIWIAGASRNGPWLLSVGHPGVATELPATEEEALGPGLISYAYQDLGALYAAVDRAYRLGLSLPQAPLERFHKQTSGMPRTTEAERLVMQRIGQNVFREALLAYWGGRCPMTGISDPAGDYRDEAAELVQKARDYLKHRADKDQDQRHQRTYQRISGHRPSVRAAALAERGQITDEQMQAAIEIFQVWNGYGRGRVADRPVPLSV